MSQQHTIAEYKPNIETIDQQVQSICFLININLRFKLAL